MTCRPWTSLPRLVFAVSTIAAAVVMVGSAAHAGERAVSSVTCLQPEETRGSDTAAYPVAATASGGSQTTPQVTCSAAANSAAPVMRLAGADRYQQALRVSAIFSSASIVFVASGEKFPDALSASAIAAAHKAPLLLTPENSLAPGLLAEIDRLGAKDVVVVGGEATVSAATFAALQSPGRTVTRIGGADRYEVSRNLIADPHFGLSPSRPLYVATGTNFPDALSASPAASSIGAPVLLVDGGATMLTPAEDGFLGRLAPTDTTVVGGLVSDAMVAAIKHKMTAGSFFFIGGDDRYSVSVNVNHAAFRTADTVILASGAVFPDALSGGAFAGAMKAPIYLTRPDCVPEGVLREIGRLAPSTIIILGGTATLSSDVQALHGCGAD